MKDVEAAHSELDAVEVPVMFGFNRRFDPNFATTTKVIIFPEFPEWEKRPL